MLQMDEETEVPGYATSGLIAYAVAINLVLVSSLATGGLLFAIERETVTFVAAGVTFLIWGGVALILIPAWLSSLFGWLRQDKQAGDMNDSWLDD